MRTAIDSNSLIAQGYTVVEPGVVTVRPPRHWNVKRVEKNADTPEKCKPIDVKESVEIRPINLLSLVDSSEPVAGDSLSGPVITGGLSSGPLADAGLYETMRSSGSIGSIHSVISSGPMNSAGSIGSITSGISSGPMNSAGSIGSITSDLSGGPIASVVNSSNLTQSGRMGATVEQQPIKMQHPSAIDHPRVFHHQGGSVDSEGIHSSTSVGGRRPMNFGASLDHGRFEKASIPSVADLNESGTFAEVIQKTKENLTKGKSLKKHPGGADFTILTEDNSTTNRNALGESEFAPPMKAGPVLSPPTTPTREELNLEPPKRIVIAPKVVEILPPPVRKEVPIVKTESEVCIAVCVYKVLLIPCSFDYTMWNSRHRTVRILVVLWGEKGR